MQTSACAQWGEVEAARERGASDGGPYFVRQHGLEAAAEVAEVVSVLVDLHALAVVLDLRVHPVGALLHGHLDGLACLRLRQEKRVLSSVHLFT